MLIPTLEREEKLFSQGLTSLAGVDEAGRGPLAGPVVAAAIAITVEDLRLKIKERFMNNNIVIRDSKTMTSLQRERAFEALTGDNGVAYGVGVVENDVIDEVGILPATLRAMKEAVSELSDIGHLLIDGRSLLEGLSIPQTAAPRLDQLSWVCAAASIIAKVARDRLMTRYHEAYPVYGFDRHKGYGTAAHRVALLQHGPSPIHRRSFALVSKEI